MRKSCHHYYLKRSWLLHLLLGCVFFTGTLQSYSQQETITVTGKVSLPGSTELSGTSVQVKGAATGASTDNNGGFTIKAPRNATLVFSRVGFKPHEVDVAGQSVINITLEPLGQNLDQVVVVSYGTQRQRSITGAVQKISAQELQDVPAAEFGQKLQGKVAGLQVSQVTGRPGQAMTFRIRGAASLGAGNQPLIVVDGQPITGDINTLNPDDIESFSVLKDASATALYGSRAANGVVIITTKQAKAGRTHVTLNTYYGWQSVPQRGRPNLMNAHEFAGFMKGYYEDKIKYENWKNPATGLAAIPDDYKNPDQYGEGTDWYDVLLRTAPIQNYSLNVTSGTDKFSSSTSLTYFNQQGVMLNTGMKRFSFRSNNEYRPFDKIKLGFNLAPTYQVDDNTRGPLDGNRQVLVGAEISSPLIAPVNADGTFPLKASSYNMYALPNYYQQILNLAIQQNTFRLLANAYADIEFLKGLHFKTTLNTDLGTADYNAFYPSTYGTFGAPPPQAAAAASSSYNYISWLNENLLTYDLKLKDHSIDLLAGYSAQRYDINTRTVNGTNFPNDAVPWIRGAATTTGSTDNADWNLASWFARVNYDYKGKYYVTGNIRRDGSSRFGNNKKWGYFPSASAGWIVSDESFFPKSTVLSLLKIRISYGLTGNNNIGNYTQTSLLGATNYIFGGTLSQGLSITSLGNPDLTWETSKQADLGVEMSLLNNRVSFTYDYYRKTTESMLYRINIPLASGYSSIAYNVGDFRMWGHEFQLSTRNLTGELKWNTNFNIAFNDNKVLRLQDSVPIGGTNKYNDYNRTAVGRRIGELWGYVFDGIYMTQDEFNKQPKEATSAVGTTRMKDTNGDKLINGNDKTYLGNPNPKYIFGMTNDFRFRNFDLNIVVAGQVGNKIMYVNNQNLQNNDGIFNMTKDMADRWRSPENPGNGKAPRTLANTTELYRLGNSNWVYPGDFLTVKNIALGYTFNLSRLKYIKSARIYTSVQQAFVFTRYPQQNPEVNDTRDSQTTAGLDNGSYPVPRTIMIGANINF
jgi:TonB-dependent starch-binding outer membrane protein SusC